MSYFDAEYGRAAALRRSRRHQHAPVFCPIPTSAHQCQLFLQTMLLTNWPPQPQQKPLSTLKRKSLSSVMDGLQRRRKKKKTIVTIVTIVTTVIIDTIDTIVIIVTIVTIISNVTIVTIVIIIPIVSIVTIIPIVIIILIISLQVQYD